MVQGQLLLLAILFGAAVGVLFTLLLIGAARRGREAADLFDRRIPDGVEAVLRALDFPAVIVDGSNAVLAGTRSASTLGIVDGRVLVHAELDALCDRARSEQASIVLDFELRRSRVGTATMQITAEAAPLGSSQVLLRVDDRSEAVRLDAVRRDFVANVSHELKTPIGAVGLLAEALHTAADDPPQVRLFADRLSTEAARLGSITREIIDFSRLQSVDPLHEPQTVSLDSVISSAIDRARVLADARSVELVTAKSRGLHVLGDEALLTTAVHNLISNAVQYSPPGGRVGIGLRAREGVAEVSVTDQGAGIAADDLQRVFERFFRGDPARSRNTGGTGLGLSIVKHVAQNHGGDVRAWSIPGRGSTFTIRLPHAEQPPDAQRRRERERA